MPQLIFKHAYKRKDNLILGYISLIYVNE